MADYNETIEFRLADGASNMMGRVELGFHGLWGSVCDRGWENQDADVICRQLGFNKALIATHNSAFGRGVGHVWDGNLDCKGEESRVEECLVSMFPASGSCLNHVEDAGVICEGAGYYV